MSSCQLIDEIIDLKQNDIVDCMAKTLSYKSLLLFHGYLRAEILNQLNDTNVPMDIITLCEQFFHVQFVGEHMSIKEIYTFGTHCYHKGELFISYEIFLYLSLFYPDNNRYHNRRGQTCEYWRLHEEAEKEYKIAIQLTQQQSHIFLWNLGLLYIRQNKQHLALNTFIKASELDPNEAEYFIKIAECYDELNDYTNAENNYLKAIEVGSARAVCYMNYARFLYTQKKLDIADKFFAKAEESLDINNWKSMYHMANYLRDYGKDYKKSEIYYLKSLEFKKKGSYVYASYGYLLYLMKRYDLARKYFDIALIADDFKFGNGGRRYLYYGLLEYEMGNIKRSEQFRQEAIKRVTFTSTFLEKIKQQNPNNIDYITKYYQI